MRDNRLDDLRRMEEAAKELAEAAERLNDYSLLYEMSTEMVVALKKDGTGEMFLAGSLESAEAIGVKSIALIGEVTDFDHTKEETHAEITHTESGDVYRCISVVPAGKLFIRKKDDRSV